MTNSSRPHGRVVIGLAALLVALTLHASAARAGDAASPLRLGGVLGFGITATRQPGAFRWDYDSARAETALAVLKLSAGTAALRGFVALGARLDAAGDGGTREFELREASLVGRWRRSASDSATVRFFARQPGSLWIDGGLVPPIVAATGGGDDAVGGRADLGWRVFGLTVLAMDRAGLAAATPATGVGPAATGDAYLVRVQAAPRAVAGLRAGVTWKHVDPAAEFVTAPPPATDARTRDVGGVDVVAGWRALQGTIEYSQSSATGAPPGSDPAHGWQSTWSSRLTNIMPSTAALRAELRTPGVRLGSWGTLGFAPQYRALGTDFVDRLVAPEPDDGAPRRGLEGYRLEAWYTAAAWPVWIRQVYDRHQQFADADRRVILQSTEAQTQITGVVRGRLLYTQREDRLAGQSTRHDDVLGECVAEDGVARLRVEAGRVDLQTASERTLIAIESAARVGSHMQALARLTLAQQAAASRHGFWIELQYWHLPGFELALQYGPDWIGDGSDPALEGDLVAAGNDFERVRLNFRGWF